MGAAGLVLPTSTAYAIDPPTVRVTPGVSSVLVGETRQLTATVSNLGTTSVTWSLRSGAGSVSATGVYTPPAQPPADPVAVVRATSTEDAGVFGEATVAVASGVPGGAFGAEVPTTTGGGQDADMGDIDGDGRTDVVMFQNCCNDLKVGNLVTLRWNGTSLVRGGPSAAVSTYQENGFTATSDHLLDIELGDLDGDGDLDVYVPFGSAQAQYWRYQVWRNNGTGTFTPDPRVRTVGGARSGARARLTDFDGDGKLDAVRMEWFGTLLLEKGNGDGTFQEPVVLMHTSDADSFDVGDLTGDGRPEIAVGIKGLSNSSTTIEVGINGGFGSVVSEVPYDVGMAPEPRIADTNGDGWNDLVVGVGGESYTYFPPRLVSLPNLGTGTGAVGAPVQLLSWRPRTVEAVHVDADGVLDLAGFTYRGPVMLRRTAPNAYSAMHAASTSSIHHATWGDVTGDGRLDVFTNFDGTSQFWPGSADPAVTFEVLPTVTRLNATHTADFAATLRNVAQEPKVTWTASRGTFNGATYTAPATAAPGGTPVTVTASLTGTTTKATRQITVVNERLQFTTLGGQDVRHVVADPAQPTHLYAATATGVYRSTSGGATFNQIGTTTPTGTNARQVAVVTDPGGTPRLLAIFGSTLFRNALDGTDWAAVGPVNAASLSAAPGSPVVWLAAGGQVHRSADAGATWGALGQTSVTEVDAIDATNVWVVRSAAPRVSRAAFSSDPAPALTMTARELPAPNAGVLALSVHPTERTLAYVATSDTANTFFRDAGGTGATGSPAWTAVPTPSVVDRVSVSATGAVVAARAATQTIYKSPDAGAAWHSLSRGFPSGTNVSSVAHRADGLELVGTTTGLYTPVEQVPPASPAVTGGPTGTTGPDGTFTFTFDTVADAASYVCGLDDVWASCTSPRQYSGPLTTGTHTFAVVAVDANGNESVPTTRTWEVDATPPPVPTIVTGPTGFARSTSAAFTFELAGDAAGATCSLDNATPVSCASGVTYSGLAQGSHSFAVRSVDAAGNASAPATRAWTVDTQPPVFPSFWSVPQPNSRYDYASFRWYSDSSATYTCTLDGSPVTCGPSSANLTGLTEGPHTFGVTASDAAGNTSANQHNWRVDLTDPLAPAFSATPDLTTSATDAYFAFASPSSDVSYYWCSLDGVQDYCYGERSVQSLSPGRHTFAVRAVDYAGRQSPPTEHVWTIVLGAPEITSGPSGLVATRAAAFTWTAAEGATTSCSLDGATPVPCESGVSFGGLGDGPHSFAVTATLNGATSDAATREWTVDATAPTTPELTAVPPLRTKSGDATFGWTVDPSLTYTCEVDGMPVACADGAYAANGVAQGSHRFVLTARDAAENESAASYSWTVDQTAPIVSIVTKPAQRTSSTSAFLEFGSGAQDLHHYTCTVDGVSSTCTSPVTLPSLDDGAHAFSVIAVDDLGNASDAATWAWQVDTTGPVVELTGKPAALTRSGAASFAFSSADDDLDGFACTVDGVTEPCSSPFDVSSLSPGTHSFSVVAMDDLRNVGEPATHSWTVDLTAPGVTIATPSAVLNPAHVVTFSEPVAGVSASTVRLLVTGTATVVPSAVTCRTAANTAVACTAGTVQRATLAPVAPLTPGQLYTISVSGVTDTAGNPAAAGSRGYRASTSEQENGLAGRPSWRRLPWSGAQGGSYHVANLRNATASYEFTGTSVTWYGVRGPTYGLADVYVDGVLKASKVNFYSTSTGALTRTIGGLSNAKHTLRIVVRGERGSTSGKGTDVAVDAFKLGTALVASPPVTFAWARNVSSASSGGAFMVEALPGATYTVTFRGRGIDWVTQLGPNMGKATVHIDGVGKGTFDNWASATKHQQVRRFGGLTDRVHTMTITVLGQRRSGATGTNVVVDRFGILP